MMEGMKQCEPHAKHSTHSGASSVLYNLSKPTVQCYKGRAALPLVK